MEWADAVKGAVIVAVTIILVACFIALPVMFLWNWIIPDIFGLTTINFRQALCLALLTRCLFGWDSIRKEDKK